PSRHRHHPPRCGNRLHLAPAQGARPRPPRRLTTCHRASRSLVWWVGGLMTGQRIVILGGGYGGQMAAARLASRCPAAVITVVDASPVFVERIRLHQVAAGEHVRERPMRDMLPKHVGLVQGRVVSWEPRRRLVRVGGGPRELAYDWCVYALGSRVDVDAVPGAREHAFALDDPAGAKRLSAATARGGRVVVVGAGLTGIEAAVELAEQRRELAVTLVAGGAVG